MRPAALFAVASLLVVIPAALAQAPPPDAVVSEASCAGIEPDDLRRICERGTLRVARYEGERPPFFFRAADGTVRGFDVDLARDIASRLGVGYEAVPAESFDRVVDLVATGEADVGISKLSITLERGKRVRFSKPYMTVYQTLLVNRLAAPRQQDPFRFLNRPLVRVGALGGSSYIEYAESEFPAADVVAYDDFRQMMDDVTSRDLDAVFLDSARANTWRRANPERLIQVRAFVARDRRDLLAFAVGWRDAQLLAWLDLYLDSVRDDGWAERLYQRWFVEAAEAGGDEAAEVGGSP